MHDRRRDRLLTPSFGALAVSAFSYFFAFGMTLPVLPSFVLGPLGGSEFQVGVVVGIVAVSSIAIRPWIASFVHRWGPTPVFILAAFTGALSIATYAVAESMWLLICFRLVTGAAQACLMVSFATFAVNEAPPSRLSQAVSYVSIGPYLGIGLGPMLGQPLVQAVGHQETFLIASLIAGVGALCTVPVRSGRKVQDISGTGRGPRLHTAALWPGVVLTLGLFGTVGLNAFIPLYTVGTLAMSPQYIFLAYAVTIVGMRLFAGTLPDRFGVGRVTVTATLLIAAGLLGVATAQAPAVLVVAVVIFAVGIALQYPSLLALSLQRADPAHRTPVISTFTIFLDLAQGVGGFIAGGLATAGGYRAVFAGSSLAALIGLLLLVFLVLPSGRRHPPAT